MRNPMVVEVAQKLTKIAKLKKKGNFTEALWLANRLQQFCTGYLESLEKDLSRSADAVAVYKKECRA